MFRRVAFGNDEFFSQHRPQVNCSLQADCAAARSSIACLQKIQSYLKLAPEVLPAGLA
ncbi:MAG: hypothetical protein ACI8P9_002946 [Parasphingorhabdus sp.]